MRTEARYQAKMWGGGGLLALVILAAAAWVPAVAHDVEPGFDIFYSPPGESYQDFSGTPIPADFFDPGSDPFVDIVFMQGVPLGEFEACPNDNLGNADTIVERQAPAVLPAPPSTDTIPIEIIQLHLRSVEPITVTFNGGMNPELWDVDVELSDIIPSVGTMTITKSHAQGGTFDSELRVFPRFTFTKVSNPTEMRVLDGGDVGLGIDFTAELIPWVHVIPPESSCASNFCVNPESLTVEQAMWAAHGVISICPQSPTAVEGVKWGSIKSLYK